MQAFLAVLLIATSVCADQKEDRRTKLPYIADAVGNTLPPPSEGPATVGSPVHLLNPDRYEFYTFDESGELVKRLMTLEEIQAIVAAGEETEGLVTFSNDNQPTVAFNFTQPSHNKVHSVVTNVQNVLKAQMEAHKKKPIITPTLDTPDVSDSWSLILPSIFGNSGIDIVPDKNTEAFITPETDTIDFDNTQSKENIHLSNEFPQIFEQPSKISMDTDFTTTTTNKPISTTKKNFISTTFTSKSTTTKIATSTPKVITSTSTTTKSPLITTKKAITTKYSTTLRPASISSTTKRPIVTTATKNKPTKLNYNSNTNTTKWIANITENKSNSSSIVLQKKPIENKKNYTTQFEKIGTFIPVTTASYITEKSTPTLLTTAHISTLSYISSGDKSANISSDIPIGIDSKLNNESLESSSIPISITDELDKINSTTMTTQSVSPSTTLTSTELTLIKNDKEKNTQNYDNSEENDKKTEPALPLFDVAQSISQIASDLGGGYSPVPTEIDNLENKKNNNLPIESKENIEIDIPAESANEGDAKNDTDFDNFVKISTLDPQETVKNNTYLVEKLETQAIFSETTVKVISTSPSTISLDNSDIDPILSESMGDMLSQVMNENSLNQLTTAKTNIENNIVSTLNPIEQTTISSEPTVKKNITLFTEPSTKLNPSKPTDTIIDKLLLKHNNTLTNNSVTKDISNEIVSSKPSIKDEFIKTESPFKEPNKTQVQNNVKEIMNQSNEISQKSSVTVNDTKIFNKTDLHKNSDTTSDLNFNISIINSKINSGLNNSTYNKDKPLDEFRKKIQKVNIDDKEVANERNNSWKLIPVVPPPKNSGIEDNNHKQEQKQDQKQEILNTPDNNIDKHIVLDFSQENQGLEVTTKELGEDILQFTDLCNELAFRYWNELIRNIDNKRSFVLSPYSITSMLAMMFMGARGGTSGEMNDILRLDDMVTFNPHFTLKNISDSIVTSSSSGVAISAFIRELYSEKSKGKILTFYKERAQHFYNGHVEEINFKLISDIIRRRTNLLVKRYTWGRIQEYMKTNSISMNPPLAAFSANIFETDCTGSSVEGRDGEMYFVVSPTVRQRRLVPVPAVVYKSNFLAGYDPILDATAAALGNTNSIISTLFLMPGQQGNVVHAEDLETLENRLLNSTPATQTWNRLLRTLLPRVGLELQIPRFSHKSLFNVTSTLRKMGLKELFDAEHADLAGMNGPSKELHLSDMVQHTTFATCGEGLIGEQHHVEEYPEGLQLRRRNSRWTTIWDEPRDYQRAFHDPHDVGDAMHLPLHLRPRQARLPTRTSQPARLKFDRPFLFFVRHNPSGMILYVGRYNPRLLP